MIRDVRNVMKLSRSFKFRKYGTSLIPKEDLLEWIRKNNHENWGIVDVIQTDHLIEFINNYKIRVLNLNKERETLISRKYKLTNKKS